jgi:class 3 adenylate cyclase/tetratricopeptide (TPR) repeat protein
MASESKTDAWLESIGLGQYAAAFADNDVDLDIAAELGDDDLKELGLSLGHRKKFQKAVAALSNAPAEETGQVAPPAVSARDPNAGAERRQLTVMFCDLVGSTAMSTQLDVEDLREVISGYQDVCRGIVDQYGGFIARYMGDGILIYFGYPQAHEDEGDRAVRTGLDIIRAVRSLRLRPDLELEVRIGVATGVVIVGDIIGEGASEESAVLGETPNLAARLQGLAEPNTMVIGPETRSLIQDRFRCTDLGEHTVKGIARPVRAWGVVEALAIGDRFGGQAYSTLVGREEELDLVHQRWNRAVSGQGQAVVISGEAGIGKSRLVQAVKEISATDQAEVVHISCSSYHAQDPLYPFIDGLTRLVGFEESDSSTQKLDKIDALLSARELDAGAVAPVLAALLSVPTDERYPPHGLSPQALKQRTLVVLGDLLFQPSGDGSLLLVFDDAHWADPTSLDLLGIALRAIMRRAVLIVVTCRPEFEAPWRGADHLTTLSLQRLTPAQSRSLIGTVAGGKGFPDSIVRTIIEKADGVPLFVEELTRNIIESGLLEENDDAYLLTGPLPPLAIPTTLHDSLMARLDRLPTAKEIAQIGSAIGRQFDYGLIASVTDLSDDKLQDALARLRDAEIVFDEGAPPNSSYLFKHALVQDAAYESLLRRPRQSLHGRIVTALETKFAETADAEPGVLGRHCMEASLFPQSAAYYQKAGLVSALRSSMAEALAQLELGLAAVAKIEDPAQRAQIELELRMTLVFPLRALKGLGANEVEQNYQRAFELIQTTGANDQVLPVLYGLFAVVWARGDIAAASRRADDLLAQAAAANDPLSLVVAHYAVGLVCFFLGKNEACLEHLDAVLLAYDPSQHAALALTYAIEFGVGAWNYRALCAAAMGRFAEAKGNLESAVELARALNHPFPLSHALGVGAAALLYFREPQAMLDWSVEAIDVAREQGFAPYLAIAQLCRGWGRALNGDHASGLADLSEGIGNWAGGGYGLATPWFQVRHAEAFIAANEPEAALQIIDQALVAIEAGPQHQFRANALVARGDVRAMLGDRDAAMTDYKTAADAAAAQGGAGEQLHALLHLARLMEKDPGFGDVAQSIRAVLEQIGDETHPEMAEARDLVAAQ